ncbi:MAG: hypothetical protein HS111_16515 [Kofleriaceae bacterium]|nr:hypothetical protein [Kofleriaceae bacterium]
MRRAATSAAANTAEGGLAPQRRRPAARLPHRVGGGRGGGHARAIAAAWGHVDAADLAEVLALADWLQAVLWRLRRSRR